MVRAGFKGKVLGKEKKLELLQKRKAVVDARVKKDDKKWKVKLATIAKKAPAKVKDYRLVGISGKHRRRGVTRRSLRKNTGRKPDTIAYETTIHMSKIMRRRTFHRRAPIAIKKIKAFAGKFMKTRDNRIDASLNTHIRSKGVKGVPGRIRLLIQRKVLENTESKRKQFYTVISHVPVDSFKKLTTKAKTE